MDKAKCGEMLQRAAGRAGPSWVEGWVLPVAVAAVAVGSSDQFDVITAITPGGPQPGCKV